MQNKKVVATLIYNDYRNGNMTLNSLIFLTLKNGKEMAFQQYVDTK